MAKEQELESKFWEALDDSPFLMIGLQGVDDAFTRPMTAQIDDRQIHFFANRTEELVKGLEKSKRAIATFASKGHDLFASIHGTLELSDDRAVVDRLWSPAVAAWFKDGKDDPELALIRFDTSSADVWEAASGAFLKAVAVKLIGRDPAEPEQGAYRAEIQL